MMHVDLEIDGRVLITTLWISVQAITCSEGLPLLSWQALDDPGRRLPDVMHDELEVEFRICVEGLEHVQSTEFALASMASNW